MKEQIVIQKIKENKLGEVYKTLYKAFPPIKSWIVKNSGTKQDAEDVFQETLLVLCINCKKENFILTANIATYLTAIAKNIWYSNLRKRGKSGHVETDEIDKYDIDFQIVEEKFTLAEQAFNLLGDKCKSLLEKFYVLKMSFEKISKDLDFSTAQIAKNQKYRCLQKAKDLYSQMIKEGGLSC